MLAFSDPDKPRKRETIENARSKTRAVALVAISHFSC